MVGAKKAKREGWVGRDEEPEATQSQTGVPAETIEITSLAEFLEGVPPSQTRKISDLATKKYPMTGPRRQYFEVKTPDILIHCSHSACNGPRFFRYVGQTRPTVTGDNQTLFYMTYRCRNCRSITKIFWLMAKLDNEDHATDADADADYVTYTARYTGECYKLGELPVYGPATPSRLISLIGPDREIFLKGRRCENQGLGIGAFVYYRRVVENQKTRILDEIIKVSEKVGASPEVIATLTTAKSETQFKKAVELYGTCFHRSC